MTVIEKQQRAIIGNLLAGEGKHESNCEDE
jgi:hypothetical protein